MDEICEICKKSVRILLHYNSDIWCICTDCNKKLDYKQRQKIWLALKIIQ